MKTKGTVLITGGAQRIGRYLALHLAEEGYDIALHYNHSLEMARETADSIQGLGRRCTLFKADFGQMADVRRLIPEVIVACPDCCILVNNASIFEKANLLETEEDLFDRHFQINFKTPFFLTRDFARRVSEGQVINLIDTKAARTVVEYFAYTLTKKALLEFTRMAAKALGPGIRVNGIAPGLILPPPGEDEAYLQDRCHSVPLKRIGSPEGILCALRYLLENEFTTGDCLYIDGGEHLK
ncbi:MAG: SDR family oxidoreductase [bacterium]|jgi:NAD(P)-dependent dehydrogenase (short-subunit alcohol dehydrogenase family)|nr:SDR family oxidoreductase [bacterium]